MTPSSARESPISQAPLLDRRQNSVLLRLYLRSLDSPADPSVLPLLLGDFSLDKPEFLRARKSRGGRCSVDAIAQPLARSGNRAWKRIKNPSANTSGHFAHLPSLLGGWFPTEPRKMAASLTNTPSAD